jgi:hypothetical protein
VTPDAIQSTLTSDQAFLAALSPDGSRVLYGTYFGGVPMGLALDPLANIYVAGYTASQDLPLTQGSLQPSLAGADDAFFAKLMALAVPRISSLSPSAGIIGTLFTINGTNFGSSTGTVTVGGVSASIQSWSDNSIVVQVPSSLNPGSVNVVVTTSVEPSNPVSFQVTLPQPPPNSPQISAISPSSGGIGTQVTITGTYFGSAQGQSTVTFNGISAGILSWSDGSITARVSGGLSPGPSTVAVHGNSATSNGVSFTVTQPLHLVPSQATMQVGQTLAVQLLDENGVLINNPAWTFDVSSVAEIIPPGNSSNSTLLQADAVGNTTLTASYGNRTGTSMITVLAAGASFPVGTIQWKSPSLGNGWIGRTVQALRVDANTPDLYVEDDGAFSNNGAIRALTAGGQQKWIWRPAGTNNSPSLVAADDQGGVLHFSGMDGPGPYGNYCYFGRLDETGNESWQYQESNCWEDYAVGPDGTIVSVISWPSGRIESK